MISYVIETLKIAGIDFFCEFEINGMENDFSQQKFLTNKWLHLDEWFCIYEKLEELACDNWITSDVNETFIVSNDIQVDVKRQELKKYYKRLLIAEGLNANSVFLKISIKKLNMKELMQDNAKLKERLRKLEEMQNVAIVNGKSSTKSNRIKMEYDPIESPAIRNEYVPISTRKTKTTTYKPKVTKITNKGSESGKYSPMPIAVCESEEKLKNLSQSTDVSPFSPHVSQNMYVLRGKRALFSNCDDKTEKSIIPKIVPSSNSRTTRSMNRENDFDLKSTKPKYMFGSGDSEMSDTNLEPNTEHAEILKPKSKIRKIKKRNRKNVDNLLEIHDKMTRTESAEVEEETLNKTKYEHKLTNSNKNIKTEILKIEKHNSGMDEELLTNALREINNQLEAKYTRDSKNEILNLNHLKIENMINTFDIFKPMLDEFRDEYKKYHSLRQMKRTADLNLLMMNLIDGNTGIAMMDHLNDHYKESQCTFPTELFSKIMLPEWTLGIYMKEHNLNRDIAIQQLRLFDKTAINDESINSS